MTRDYRPIELETEFLEQPAHHRWLLTTCIVGTAATLLLGGITLGLFGKNAAPPEANAAVSPTEITGKSLRDKLSANLITASLKDPKVDVLPERNLNQGWAYPEIKESELPYNDSNTAVLDAEIGQVESEKNNITELSKSPPPEPVDETFKLAKGASLIEELTNRGVSQAAAEALVKSIEPVLPTKTIKAGTEFEVTFDRQIDFYGREVIFPVELSFRPTPKQMVIVSADEDGNFEAAIDGKSEVPKPAAIAATDFRTKARIGSSLYSTAKDNSIPEYIVAEFARVFSYDVDFQNQIKPTDDFELFFGKPLGGSSSKRKVLHFARLNYGGQTKTYFRFTSADGQTDYYDDTGRSASRALLKTPVSGVKITSGFGMRVHPLLGYSKMHEGVDFGAPTGTPIRAAGSGTIDIAGRHGGYGNTIVIQHNSRFKTLYAHMSRFAAGITAGTHVNQGQIIGYVGTTGRSTGPHLHFEVRVADHPVNPLNVRATGGRQLAGKDIANFHVNQKKILAMMQSAPSSTQLAQVGQ